MRFHINSIIGAFSRTSFLSLGSATNTSSGHCPGPHRSRRTSTSYPISLAMLPGRAATKAWTRILLREPASSLSAPHRVGEIEE